MKQSGNSILLNKKQFKDESEIEKAVTLYQPFKDFIFYDVKFNLNPKGYFRRHADLILIDRNFKFWGIVEVETEGSTYKYQNHISHQLKEQNSLIDYNWSDYHIEIMKKMPIISKSDPTINTLIQFNKPFHFLLSDSEYNSIYNKLFDINNLVLSKFTDTDNNTGFSTVIDYCHLIRENIAVIYSDGLELFLPNPNLIGIELNKQILINHDNVKRNGFFIGDTSLDKSRLYESGVLFFDTGNKFEIKRGKYKLKRIGINNYKLINFTI